MERFHSNNNYYHFTESIAVDHHYTSDLLNASVVAAKAGTCLEDGNDRNKTKNAFDNLGDAVAMVSIVNNNMIVIVIVIVMIMSVCCHRA